MIIIKLNDLIRMLMILLKKIEKLRIKIKVRIKQTFKNMQMSTLVNFLHYLYILAFMQHLKERNVQRVNIEL